jgi:hypothetical protein
LLSVAEEQAMGESYLHDSAGPANGANLRLCRSRAKGEDSGSFKPLEFPELAAWE